MLLAKIGMGILGTALVAGGILSSEGFVHVRVVEKHKNGTHLWLVVPAMVAPIALRLAPAQPFQQAGENLRPWLPAVRAGIGQLAKCPDGTLVEVVDPKEHVRVVKSGGSLVVDVDDPGETVHVSVPLDAARDAANVLAERTAAN